MALPQELAARGAMLNCKFTLMNEAQESFQKIFVRFARAAGL